jgi:gliding motility-associated-like protein
MLQQLRSKGYLFLLFTLFFCQQAFSQLTDFTLTATATNETCTANGAVSFAVSGTTTGSILVYRIFKLPDTTTPIAVTSTLNLGGLTAGDYRIVAIQSLGNLSNTQQVDVHINNLIVPVVFQVVGQPAQYCGTTAGIQVNVTQGVPVTYEIISGPVTFAPQPSNTFSGLPPGDYVIRVNDNCGDGVVQTYHFEPPPPNLSLSFVPNCSLANCNTKNISFNISAQGTTQIGYPLQVEFTLSPQGFPVIVQNQTITSGGSSITNVPYTIPYHNIANYTGSIKVTDACGNIYTLNGVNMDMMPKIDVGVQPTDSCNEMIGMSLCNMLPPFTVTFTSAPAGFNAVDFNSGHPGPFMDPSIVYASNGTHELPEGTYAFQVTDACGRTVNGSANIIRAITDHKLVILYQNCQPMHYVFIPNEGISPATVVLTSAPTGYPGIVPDDMSDMILGGVFSMYLPTVPGTYVFEGINVCGDTYIRTVTIIPPVPELIAVGSTIPICGLGTATIQLTGAPPMATVIMTAAPASYPNTPPYDVSGFIQSPTTCNVTGLTAGNYTFVVTDACGTTYPAVTVTVSPGTGQNVPVPDFLRGCAIGEGSIRLKAPISKLVQVIITSAPAGFPNALPYDVSFNIQPGTGIFFMNSLPQGTYVFHTKDLCNIESDVTLQMLGSQVTTNEIDVIANCGSFNLDLEYVELQPFSQDFFLQKRNPLTGQWGHPLTGIPYPEGTPPNAFNSYQVINHNINYNIAAYGTFRILKRAVVYANAATPTVYTNCYIPIKEFEFTNELSIVSTGAVPCSNSSYDVFITAQGVAPYIYRITEKDGQPFFVNNGNSNMFTGLASGIYNFQVEDSCGNIVNRLLDITILELPSVLSDSLCEGLNGQLSVQAISFLSYQWWKAGAPGTILSTTNELDFTPFSNATSPGTYYVRVYSTNNLSCIDMTIPYVVSPSAIPNAGTDGTRTICGSGSTIDLFTLLGAPYDTGGTWTETTASGALSGNNWSSQGVAFGTYSFVYSVTSAACGLTDTANVTIRLNPVPADPIVNVAQSFCNNDPIAFELEAIPGATYHWTGPNNFSSNLQNPIIENSTTNASGTYTVTASLNGCESSASVTIAVEPLPDFKIDAGCVSGIYTIAVKPNESLTTQYDSYSWTGPNGFSTTGNPVNLTGGTPGIYTVTVTNIEGCSIEKSVQVTNTLCSIPNVITPNGDDINQNFDLSGLDVLRLEIYSRWGRLVYEANNYIDQWHGQNMHGGQLPDSTYYYIIYLKTGQEKQGWVFKQAW